MSLFVEGDENLALARLFENLKMPSDPNKFDLELRLDDNSSTPLHWAAGCARLSLVHALLVAGADPTTYAYGGETPLMRAVYTTRNFKKRTFANLVQLLKKSVYSRDCHSRTIMHHIAIISQAPAKREMSSYYFTCIADYISQARAIAAKAMQVLDPKDESAEPAFIDFIDAQDVFDETALHIACRYKNYRIVDILLQLGASSQIPNQAGQTFQSMTHNDIRFQRLLKRKILVLLTYYRWTAENLPNQHV
jgi:Ankyrin repeat